MIDPLILCLTMFAVTCGLLMTGFPVAFTLAGSALAFALFGSMIGVFPISLLGAFPQSVFGLMTNEVLVAVPLFIFMGVMLERSQIAQELLENMGALFGALPGGLAISVCIVGALLAASTGIVGATVVTMGAMSLPTMLSHGYSKPLACGTIAASGTLGQIIPPSIVLVLLGDILQGANTQAQLAKGNFAPDPVSVVDLFAGAFLPGMMLVVLYMLWVLFMGVIRPNSCPPVERGDDVGHLGLRVLHGMVPPAILIMAVLGSILLGIATPTESAALGVLAALALVAWRRRLTISMLRLALEGTMRTTAMIMAILVAAYFLNFVINVIGLTAQVNAMITELGWTPMQTLLGVIFFYVVLGMFMETLSMMVATVPIITPVIVSLGFDPVWFGIIIILLIETAMITPPVGINLFVVQGVRGRGHLHDVMIGATPFVITLMVMIVLLIFFPDIAMWLPNMTL